MQMKTCDQRIVIMDGESGKMIESSLAIFSGEYCRSDEITSSLAEKIGLRLVRDEEVAAAAANLSGLPGTTIFRAFSAKQSVFDKFTHEKNRALAYLRLALAELMTEPRLLLAGYISHLIPTEISHVLRVCLISDMPSRIQRALEQDNLSEAMAMRRINKSDNEKSHWTEMLHNTGDPWNPALYDMQIPTSINNSDQIVHLIKSQLEMSTVQQSEVSRQALADFQTAARASVTLVRSGHDGVVTSHGGNLTVTIKMKVLMFNRLLDELQAVLSPLPGVQSVKVEVDSAAHHAGIYRKFDQATPSKVLLVDDEHEFVQTLSERLIFRNMGTAVAFDGPSALEMLIDDDPDVMVLDLKMPGIDGIEVLRQVKKIRPLVDVIILTGHGSETDRETCMDLGAFAYMHKPVDIDLLSTKLKEAHDRVKNRKSIS
jgi:two-component system, OmpR family, response regulator CpxR